MQTEAEGAVNVCTLEDALDPNRFIDVYAAWENNEPALGNKVIFTAVLNGYENAVYVPQWQQSTDNEIWTDIDGANDLTYEVQITEENIEDYWRVQVIISDIVDVADTADTAEIIDTTDTTDIAETEEANEAE